MGQEQAKAQAISIAPAAESGQTQRGSIMVAPRNGLELPRRLSFDKWLDIGMYLSAVTTSSAWCLGDWLAYGIESFSGRYRDALEQTSLDYQTLRNYVWVAKRFPRSRRRVALSFGHHAEVAALPEPEQDFWLRKAEEFTWSVKQLRQEVRASLRQRTVSGEVSGGKADDSYRELHSSREEESVQLEIRISPIKFEVCQDAAAKAGLNIQEWVIMALIKVAHDTVGAQI
jgi:predicted HicB family RNase H-like nuclease